MKRIKLSVLKHIEVCLSPYDVFSATIETKRLGFGFRVHDWRSKKTQPHEWGLRIEFWRWHFCWHLTD